MVSESVVLNSPNTNGPIELLLKMKLMRGGSPVPEENALVDEYLRLLTDEHNRILLNE